MEMKQLNQEQTEQAAFAMRVRGGSFIQRIGEAYMHADPRNQGRLYGAFEREFEDYYATYCGIKNKEASE